jgi:methylthioribose-1-phosphate isomerase
MKINGKQYRSVWKEDTLVHFIDQRKLPYSFQIFTARTVKDVAYAIKDMVVRGAPAIGAAAAYYNQPALRHMTFFMLSST